MSKPESIEIVSEHETQNPAVSVARDNSDAFVRATAAGQDSEHPECTGCGKRHPPHAQASPLSVTFFDLLEKLSSDSPREGAQKTSATAAAAVNERQKEVALKRIADNFKHVAVSKSADRTLAILARFETILTHMKSTGKTSYYDVTLIRDIEQIYRHVKTIYSTRSWSDFYQATDRLESMLSQKMGGKQTARIYKYAVGAGRLLAGQIAIEFLRTKLE